MITSNGIEFGEVEWGWILWYKLIGFGVRLHVFRAAFLSVEEMNTSRFCAEILIKRKGEGKMKNRKKPIVTGILII